ncbi:MAG: hypothetical protein AAB870_04490 [Patescibacteria group bacterium]
MNIAIISSAHPELPNFLGPTLDVLIAQLKTIPNIKILTGGSLGIPGEIVKKANKAGIHTVAYSPDEDKEKHHKRHDNLRLHHFNEVKHFPGFTMRSLEMIKDADCVIALNGRMGTLSEITIALEEGKRVGIITGTGGIADHFEDISVFTQKDFSQNLFFSDDPKEVVKWVTGKQR